MPGSLPTTHAGKLHALTRDVPLQSTRIQRGAQTRGVEITVLHLQHATDMIMNNTAIATAVTPKSWAWQQSICQGLSNQAWNPPNPIREGKGVWCHLKHPTDCYIIPSAHPPTHSLIRSSKGSSCNRPSSCYRCRRRPVDTDALCCALPPQQWSVFVNAAACSWLWWRPLQLLQPTSLPI